MKLPVILYTVKMTQKQWIYGNIIYIILSILEIIGFMLLCGYLNIEMENALKFTFFIVGIAIFLILINGQLLPRFVEKYIKE